MCASSDLRHSRYPRQATAEIEEESERENAAMLEEMEKMASGTDDDDVPLFAPR